MKISTKTGDNGETGLFGGRRVSKASPIIEIVGELDELHSVLGWTRFGVPAEKRQSVEKLIGRVQENMFRILAVAGAGMKPLKNLRGIDDEDIKFLEMALERYEKIIGGISKFIHPGTTEAAARFHMARAHCRSVERLMVKYGKKIKIPKNILIYLNRLSDLLFVMAYVFEKK